MQDTLVKVSPETILEQATRAAEDAMDAYLAAWLQAYPDNKFGEPAACGFAWVVIPGRDPLANWCRKQGGAQKYGSKHWQKGWMFWGPGEYPGQSVYVKEVGAKAFASVLRAYGIKAEVGSRLD